MTPSAALREESGSGSLARGRPHFIHRSLVVVRPTFAKEVLIASVVQTCRLQSRWTHVTPPAPDALGLCPRLLASRPDDGLRRRPKLRVVMELSRHDAILLTYNNVFFDRIADVELCCLGGCPPSSDHGAIQLTVLQ